MANREWAMVGDLVFLVNDKGKSVPAKIKSITKDKFIFEPIVEDIKIPFESYPKKLCGYNGGRVFKNKSNAEDYIKIKEENNGEFKFGDMIKRKTTKIASVQKNKPKESDSIIDASKILLSAIVLAMNQELKIGPKRAARVIERANKLIEEKGAEEVIKEAEEKMF